MHDLNLSILKALHEDHLATLALLERLEAAVTRQGPGEPPAADDATFRSLLPDLIATMEAEISAHFSFEEQHLFPRFAEFVDPSIPTMLQGEHDVIRPLAGALTEMAREALDKGFSEQTWNDFYDKGLELVEREVFHVQKEEMGFLPALDQFLDPADDGELTMAYGEAKAGS
jgi:DUF438 domain-containing protein